MLELRIALLHYTLCLLIDVAYGVSLEAKRKKAKARLELPFFLVDGSATLQAICDPVFPPY